MENNAVKGWMCVRGFLGQFDGFLDPGGLALGQGKCLGVKSGAEDNRIQDEIGW